MISVMPWAAMSRTRPPMSAAPPVRAVCGTACQLPAAQAAVSVAEIFILVMGQIAV
jgi:hypothetical protein